MTYFRISAGGGPKRLRVLLEGEALLNDASSFTLFEIFLHLVEQLNTGEYHAQSGWAVLWSIVKSALKLAGGKFNFLELVGPVASSAMKVLYEVDPSAQIPVRSSKQALPKFSHQRVLLKPACISILAKLAIRVQS